MAQPRGKIFNRPITANYLGAAGQLVTIGTTEVKIEMVDGDGHILLSSGTTVPSSLAGFSKAGTFRKTDAGAATEGLYRNTGLTTSCTFEALDSIVAGEIALADGDLLVGNVSAVAAAVTMSGHTTMDNLGEVTVSSAIPLVADLSNGSGEVTIIHTDDGSEGAELILYQNSASPAAMDSIGLIGFEGKDDGGNVTEYVTIEGIIADPTGGAELGGLLIGGQDGSGSHSEWMSILRESTEVKLSAFNSGDSFTIDTDGSGDINLSPGGASNVVLDGGIVYGERTTTSGAGAVAITGGVHEVTTTGTGDALTLANGTAGQRLCVVYVAEGAGGDTAVITPATLAGGSTITLNNLGDSCDLVYSSTGGWYVLGLGGAAAVA
jgi:hypothetical protein